MATNKEIDAWIKSLNIKLSNLIYAVQYLKMPPAFQVGAKAPVKSALTLANIGTLRSQLPGLFLTTKPSISAQIISNFDSILKKTTADINSGKITNALIKKDYNLFQLWIGQTFYGLIVN
jgi:hypothetical protein